jgi:hypothetical protein
LDLQLQELTMLLSGTFQPSFSLQLKIESPIHPNQITTILMMKGLLLKDSHRKMQQPTMLPFPCLSYMTSRTQSTKSSVPSQSQLWPLAGKVMSLILGQYSDVTSDAHPMRENWPSNLDQIQICFVGDSWGVLRHNWSQAAGNVVSESNATVHATSSSSCHASSNFLVLLVLLNPLEWKKMIRTQDKRSTSSSIVTNLRYHPPSGTVFLQYFIWEKYQCLSWHFNCQFWESKCIVMKTCFRIFAY